MADFDPRGECLDVTTARVCSVNCRPWCPQMEFRQAYGDQQFHLQFEDFKLALSKTPRRVNIVFAGFSEPFMNARALDMIELAKAEGFKVGLFSTLVGLRPEDVPRLKAVDFFVLHLPDDQGIAHMQLTDLYCRTLATAFQTLKIDQYSRMTLGFYGQDRAGNAPVKAHERHVRGPFYCRRLTHPQPVMLPNLDLLLCSQDWLMKHRLGNLREQSYDEIIDGELFREIRRSRYAFDGDELCRGCSNAWSPPKALAIEAMLPLYKRAEGLRRRSEI